MLDVACGEGYGSALLAEAAAHVTGVDIDATTLAHARATYAGRANVQFVEGSATALPVADASVDAVVSFETIEHLEAPDQPRMLAEFARVLTRDGVLMLSSPNRPEYSEARNYVNPFHLHELDRDELAQLLEPHFPAQRWHRQRRYLGSALWSEQSNDRFEASMRRCDNRWHGNAARGDVLRRRRRAHRRGAARNVSFIVPFHRYR